VDKIRPQANTLDASFNAAIIAAAQVDGTAKGLDGKGAGQDGEQLQNYPKLFGGENLRCNRPTGGFGQLLNKNCCRTNLERPKKGVLIQQGCGMDEVKLAAARRSSYAHYVGEYCSRKFLGSCLRRTESYCVYQGILPRIIQEQGREQLEKMTANSTNASVQRKNISFSFYHSGAGAWSAPTDVNGVRVSAWQWPSYCSSPAAAGEKLATDPNSKECPGAVSIWFAACDKAECGALPEQPQDGSVDWQMKMVNPLEKVSTAISRYSVVTGACAPKSQYCDYSVAAWPLGVGGRAVVSRELTWDLFGQNEVAQSGVTPKQFVDNNMGDFIFRSFSESGAAGGGKPATVRLDFSRDGGQTWTQHEIPTSKKGEEISLPNSDVKLVGFCESSSNACEFRATGTVVITAKPWGDAKNPDCSGYSPGQLSVLDFSRMDLSEWLATVMDKLGSGVDAAGLAQQAQAQGVAFNQLFQPDAVLTSNPPVAANFARVVPAEGFGPFKAKLAVSGYWPEVTGDPAKDKDKVLSATVDWGDCSAPQALEAVPVTSGAGFRGEHEYEVPDSDNHACLKKSAADNLERNIVHSVTITVNTSLSGTKVRKVSVENAWAVFPGAEKNNDKVAHPENRGKLLESNNPASPMSSVR
ncbi:conjugal transfer protein TraN, partial [Nostoc sp. CHAB 5834]|nr:conjugal transfer protein TraN [Nostoc sp. CHAB 5834]